MVSKPTNEAETWTDVVMAIGDKTTGCDQCGKKMEDRHGDTNSVDTSFGGNMSNHNNNAQSNSNAQSKMTKQKIILATGCFIA